MASHVKKVKPGSLSPGIPYTIWLHLVFLEKHPWIIHCFPKSDHQEPHSSWSLYCYQISQLDPTRILAIPCLSQGDSFSGQIHITSNKTETGTAQALFSSQRIENQESSLWINFSTHLGGDFKYIGGLKWKEEIWKKRKEYSWIISEQGSALDLELVKNSLSVLT